MIKKALLQNARESTVQGMQAQVRNHSVHLRGGMGAHGTCRRNKGQTQPHESLLLASRHYDSHYD